jgi:hypothetical protein
LESDLKENIFVIDGRDFRTALLPVRILGFVLIAVLLRYIVLDFGDIIISQKPILYFTLLFGITVGVYMLSVQPLTALVARNAQAMEILEDFIEDENKRLDFLVDLKLYKEGSIPRPSNGKGLAMFHFERKDRKNILKIKQ